MLMMCDVSVSLFVTALMDDQGEYILNGYNVITQYPRVFPYGGVTFEYTGTNSTLEKVNTTFARRLKRDLTVEVSAPAVSVSHAISKLINHSIQLLLIGSFVTKGKSKYFISGVVFHAVDFVSK